MALCFVHSAAGYLAYEAVRPAGPHRPRLLAAAVALANTPDLDFLPGLVVGAPGAYHRGVTHTIAAMAVVAVFVSLGARLLARARPAWRTGAWAAAVWGSHLLVDFFTTNLVPPRGARFLWPLSDRYYLAPVTPLPEIIIDPSGRSAFFASLVAGHTAAVWAQEIAILVLVVAAVHAFRAWQGWLEWADVPEEGS